MALGELRIGKLTLLASDIIDIIYPVGSFYTQYPDADSDVESVAFPDASKPASMWAGTVWEEKWSDEGIFFRTGGGHADSDRSDGRQEDDWRELYFQGTSAGYSHTQWMGKFTRTLAGVQSGVTPTRWFAGHWAAPGNGMLLHYAEEQETRPVNRLVKIWKRIS